MSERDDTSLGEAAFYTRRACSCGEAWADEPGHDDEDAHAG